MQIKKLLEVRCAKIHGPPVTTLQGFARKKVEGVSYSQSLAPLHALMQILKDRWDARSRNWLGCEEDWQTTRTWMQRQQRRKEGGKKRERKKVRDWQWQVYNLQKDRKRTQECWASNTGSKTFLFHFQKVAVVEQYFSYHRKGVDNRITSSRDDIWAVLQGVNTWLRGN